MKELYTRTYVTSILKSVDWSAINCLNDLHEMVKMFEQLQFEPHMASYPKLDKETTIDSLGSRLICEIVCNGINLNQRRVQLKFFKDIRCKEFDFMSNTWILTFKQSCLLKTRNETNDHKRCLELSASCWNLSERKPTRHKLFAELRPRNCRKKSAFRVTWQNKAMLGTKNGGILLFLTDSLILRFLRS